MCGLEDQLDEVKIQTKAKTKQRDDKTKKHGKTKR
jgi:hypothetical protein